MALVDYTEDNDRNDGNPGAVVPVGEDSERRYAACIAASKQARWDIDLDVIRGREFDPEHKFLPDGLSLANAFPFLWKREKRRMSQVQGRTYANVFALVERFINAKVLEVSRAHWLGNQTALHALVRFSDEEIKHQELFRQIDGLAEATMPAGYSFTADADAVAGAVLGKSTWAVLGLTLHIELFTQAHYKVSIAPDPDVSPLFKDVFLYHWREERQHAVIDEIEWRSCDATLSAAERDRAVDELIELVVAVDGVLQQQAISDAEYFFATNDRIFGKHLKEATSKAILKAYRWQYILSGASHPHFVKVLTDLTTPDQQKRIQDALATLA